MEYHEITPDELSELAAEGIPFGARIIDAVISDTTMFVLQHIDNHYELFLSDPVMNAMTVYEMGFKDIELDDHIAKLTFREIIKNAREVKFVEVQVVPFPYAEGRC